MGDDVGVDAEDAGVSASDPGQAVGAQLSHSAGQVQGAAHHRRQVHHLIIIVIIIIIIIMRFITRLKDSPEK